MNKNKKIYKLLSSCDKVNFELAYELSKNIKDFSLDELMNYNDVMKKLEDINNFYIRLRTKYVKQIVGYYCKNEANNFYMENLKDLSVDLDIITPDSFVDCIEVVYSVYNNINEIHNCNGELRFYYKIINRQIKFSFFKFDLNIPFQLDKTYHYDFLKKQIDELKKCHESILDKKITERYFNQITDPQFLKITEYIHFVKSILSLTSKYFL